MVRLRKLGAHYGERQEAISDRASIVRIDGASADYIAKEELRFELPILALARPVQKKNLCGLIRAYGDNAHLKKVANLVIYAGTRDTIAEEDAESREVLTELLTLIDDDNLWSKVTLPTTHRQEDVVGIYRNAAVRRGVFVNPALNEPLGLTLLEAAASGLPIVATNRGGPDDILKRCLKGVLVDQTDSAAIGAAVLGLLEDDDAWAQASRNGLQACGYYSWDRHAKDYLAELDWLITPRTSATETRPHRQFDTMLVCDIDNTLSGDSTAIGRLEDWLRAHPRTGFGIATGRSLHSAIDIIRQWDIPTPDVLITSVGSEIYWVHDKSYRDLKREGGWPPLGRGTWSPGGIATALQCLGWLEPQPPQ